MRETYNSNQIKKENINIHCIKTIGYHCDKNIFGYDTCATISFKNGREWEIFFYDTFSKHSFCRYLINKMLKNNIKLRKYGNERWTYYSTQGD